MRIKAALSLLYARQQIKRRDRWLRDPIGKQRRWMYYLLAKGRNTQFGTDHNLGEVGNYDDWKEAIPIRDYEGLRDYINRLRQGEENILWPKLPLYLAKTSGTTSGAKYIPLTRRSMPFHIRSAKMALLSYISETEQTDFVAGKMMFLQGSPALHDEHGLKVGRLSGITAHHVPSYLLANRVPSMDVNLIEDWEQKVEAIVAETCTQDLRLISGIPSWLQMYFERLLLHTGKDTVREVFPSFNLMVHGGVNYRPYAARFRELIGAEIPSIELYPASEGFIAYQDCQHEEGLLLEADSGMFFEFIPVEEFYTNSPSRIWLRDVQVGVNYVIIISNVAGLWGYNLGDTVKFVSVDPHRIIVTGRIKHFTSAFGEHVIAEEVERAMISATQQLDVSVHEFHVAPQTNPDKGLPYHEWFIETGEQVGDIEGLAQLLDTAMQGQNPYYRDLIQGKVLRPLVIRPLRPGAFKTMMHERGKLGGQNKVPRLANDRSIADFLGSHQD